MQIQADTAKTKEKVKGISLRVVIVSAISALLLFTLFFITNEIVLEGETGFDAWAFSLLKSITTQGTTRLMLFLTFFGSTKFLLPAYSLLTLYYMIFKKSSHRSFNVAAIGISSACLLFLVKHIFRRHRPPEPLIANVYGFSYPSGHSFSAFTFCGMFIYILWKSSAPQFVKWFGSIVLFAIAACIALSRVYLHVHYASDVVAGFCLSTLWLCLCIYVLNRMRKNQSLNTVDF